VIDLVEGPAGGLPSSYIWMKKKKTKKEELTGQAEAQRKTLRLPL